MKLVVKSIGIAFAPECSDLDLGAEAAHLPGLQVRYVLKLGIGQVVVCFADVLYGPLIWLEGRVNQRYFRDCGLYHDPISYERWTKNLYVVVEVNIGIVALQKEDVVVIVEIMMHVIG